MSIKVEETYLFVVVVINGESSEGIGVGVGIAGGTECSHVMITVELLGAKLQIGMGVGEGKQKWRGREKEECSRNEEEQGFHFITADSGGGWMKETADRRCVRVVFNSHTSLFAYSIPSFQNTPTRLFHIG